MTDPLDSDGRPFVPLPTIMRYQVQRRRRDARMNRRELWWGQKPVDFELVHPGIHRYATRPAEAQRHDRKVRLHMRFFR